MKNLIILVLLCFAIEGGAQQAQVLEKNSDPAFQQLIGRNYIDKGLTQKGIFFRNPYLPGSVFFSSGDSVDGIYLRYSSLDDDVLWLNKDFGQIKLDKASLTGFRIKSSDTVFSFKKNILKSTNDSAGRFYQEIYTGRAKLLALRKVKQISNYVKFGKQFSVYAPDPQFVLIINNQEYLVKNMKVKEFYKLFPEKKNQIAQLLKQDRLHISNESDFVTFIRRIEPILLN